MFVRSEFCVWKRMGCVQWVGVCSGLCAVGSCVQLVVCSGSAREWSNRTVAEHACGKM